MLKGLLSMIIITIKSNLLRMARESGRSFLRTCVKFFKRIWWAPEPKYNLLQTFISFLGWFFILFLRLFLILLLGLLIFILGLFIIPLLELFFIPLRTLTGLFLTPLPPPRCGCFSSHFWDFLSSSFGTFLHLSVEVNSYPPVRVTIYPPPLFFNSCMGL